MWACVTRTHDGNFPGATRSQGSWLWYVLIAVTRGRAPRVACSPTPRSLNAASTVTDKDGDGKITKKEALDLNADGRVSHKEFALLDANKNGDIGKQERLDINRDGHISQHEQTLLDKNGDGSVSRHE